MSDFSDYEPKRLPAPTVEVVANAMRRNAKRRCEGYLMSACYRLAHARGHIGSIRSEEDFMLVRDATRQELEGLSIAGRFNTLRDPHYDDAIDNIDLSVVTDMDDVSQYYEQRDGVLNLIDNLRLRPDMKIIPSPLVEDPAQKSRVETTMNAVYTQSGLYLQVERSTLLAEFDDPNNHQRIAIRKRLSTINPGPAPTDQADDSKNKSGVIWGRNVLRNPYKEPRIDFINPEVTFVASAIWARAVPS